jgi:hypothetical protein
MHKIVFINRSKINSYLFLKSKSNYRFVYILDFIFILKQSIKIMDNQVETS